MVQGVSTSPRIIGRPAYGLSGTPTWAANAQVVTFGADAERKTAHILDRLATTATGPTVLHDVRIPIKGFTANIDHIVVSGHTVWLIDSKAWKPGFVWTVGGVTRRGMARFPACDKQTVAMARDAFTRHLTRRAPAASLAKPLVVVWPTSAGTVHTWAARFDGGQLVTPRQLRHALRGATLPADHSIVRALAGLVNGPRPVGATSSF